MVFTGNPRESPSWDLEDLEALSRVSLRVLPHSLPPPTHCGLNSGSWPWPRSCDGLEKASGSKPALAPVEQMPQRAVEGKNKITKFSNISKDCVQMKWAELSLVCMQKYLIALEVTVH